MGPYYQKTAQGVGGIVETFYDHPILMVLLVGGFVALGAWFWRNAK